MNLSVPIPVAADLGMLSSIEGSAGALLLNGRTEVASTLSWSDERAERLCRLIDALCEPLLKAGRVLDVFYAGFDQGGVMMVTKGDWRLVQVMGADKQPLPGMRRAAIEFLAKHEAALAGIGTKDAAGNSPAPDSAPSPTPVVSGSVPASAGAATPSPANLPIGMLYEILVSRLAMVMGRKSAESLVGKNLQAGGPGIDRQDALARARRILEMVPNRAKREALILEVATLLQPPEQS